MRLIFFLIIVFLITSCNKQKAPYIFEGKVTDKLNNQVSNATVELIAYYNSSNAISPGGLAKLASATTNNAGQFKASFSQATGIKYYQVNVFAGNYFPFYKEYINADNFINGRLKFNPVIFKIATIKISFKNVLSASNSDEFHFYQENELFGGGFETLIERRFAGGTFNELEHTYTGNLIEGFEITKTKGDTNTYINWTSKKNGIINYKRDSVYIKSGSEGSYIINY